MATVQNIDLFNYGVNNKTNVEIANDFYTHTTITHSPLDPRASGNIPNPDFRVGVNKFNNDREKLQLNKYDFTTTQYPANVAESDELGHFIIFNINITEDSAFASGYNNITPLDDEFSSKDRGKYSRPGFTDSDMASLEKATSDKIKEGAEVLSKLNPFGEAAQKGLDKGEQFLLTKSQEVIETQGKFKLSKNTKRIKQAVVLYMPESLETKYSADWSESSFDSRTLDLAASLKGKIKNADANRDVAFNAMDLAAGFIDKLDFGGFFDVNAKDFLKISGQRARNPHLEFMFNGISNRKFSFTFTFMPKDNYEVNLVDNIIHTFKFHAAPEILGNNKAGAYYRYPSTFDIMFVANKKENKRINKISTCVLDDIDIAYSVDSDTWVTFRPDPVGSMPTSTKLTLSFTETEQITKERIQEGF